MQEFVFALRQAKHLYNTQNYLTNAIRLFAVY